MIVIAELVTYGGVLYWTLLFFFTYMVTIYAVRATDLVSPILWAGTLLVFVFGFTSYDPAHLELCLGVVVYGLIGAAHSYYRWHRLVSEIKDFVRVYEGISDSDYNLRHILYETFKPMNAKDTMSLPPEPYEFHTRLMSWALFWPSHTVFVWMACFHRGLTRMIWKSFKSISKRAYED